MNPVVLVCGADDGFARPLAVTLYSALRNYRGSAPVQVHIVVFIHPTGDFSVISNVADRRGRYHLDRFARRGDSSESVIFANGGGLPYSVTFASRERTLGGFQNDGGVVFSYSAALGECIAGSTDLAVAKRFVFDSVLRAPDLGRSVALTAAHMGLTPLQVKDCARTVRSSTRRAEEKRAADRLGVVGTPTFIVGQIDAKGRLTGWPYIGLEPDSLRHLIDVAATTLSRRH
jgi:hypothetical protein